MRRKIHLETDEANITATPESLPFTDVVDGVQVEGVPSDEATGADPESDQLRARVAELEKQVETERGNHLRALADFQNYKRRSDEQRGELNQFANRELILGLLPVLDNFERALSAAEQTKSYEALMGGVGLTLRQLQEFLKKHGVETIDAQGKEFNPEFHEAVARVEDGEHPDNTVVEELQRGYTMHSKVLRPSMVKVARS